MKLSRKAAFLPVLFPVLSLAAGCSGGHEGSTTSVQHLDPSDPSADAGGGSSSGPQLCAALRGNGEDIYAHFVSLAHLIEQFGLVDAAAGGSSSTITMFTYESILKNPALRDCSDASGARSCSDTEVAQRAALLLKSAWGYGETVGVSDGILGNAGITQLVAQIQSQGLDSVVQNDPTTAATQLLSDLTPEGTARLGILINPDLVAMLNVTDPTLLKYNTQEVLASIEEFGNWTIPDNRLFFRPGVIDWDAAAGSTFARLGDFYAGYGPADTTALKQFLDECAAPAVGQLWVDPNNAAGGINGIATPDGSTCGAVFSNQVTTYLAAASLQPTNSRIDEPIGATFNAIAAVSVVTGDSVGAYATALSAYQSGQYPTGSIPFSVSFDDIKVGYWGAEPSLSTILSNPEGYTDLRTSKTMSLGTETWRTILSHSPAEPGISNLRNLSNGDLSAGGWVDLAPVLALKNLGCQRVVYVTRHDPESVFTTGVAQDLGMTAADSSALYDLSNPASSFSLSVAQATGVWCTNWDAFTDQQMPQLQADAYGAPLETHDPFFAAYSNVTPATNLPGCTPGVAQ